MPVHHEDFGVDIVTLHGNDIFFLDTNVVIAYLYKKDRHHKVCTVFLNYLLSRDAILCMSEVVVAEVINGLARIFYTEDQVSTIGGDPRYHRSRWGTYVIKNDKASLSKFNQIACEKLAPLLPLCLIAPADEEQILDGMQMSYEYPLASADALIVSAALHVDASGIISLDRDMRLVHDVSLYTTSVDNDQFDSTAMISRLGIRFQNYLLSTLGELEYKALFPQSTIS